MLSGTLRQRICTHGPRRACIAAARLLSATAPQTDEQACVPAIQHVKANDRDNMLHIQWADGHRSRFPYVWLRDCAPAARTIESEPGGEKRRVLSLSELNLNVRPESVELTSTGVKICWPPYYQVQYPSEWLREYDNSTDSLNDSGAHLQPQDPVTWNRTDMGANASGIPSFRYSELRASEALRGEAWQQFSRKGLLRIKCKTEGVADIEAETMRMFGIQPMGKRRPLNARAHELHTAAPHLDTPPSVTLLSIRGMPGAGTFQLVDGLHLGNTIKEKHAGHFRWLMDVPIEYSRSDGNTTQVNHHPIYRASGDLSSPWTMTIERVVFNNELRSSRIRLSPTELQKFYASLKFFNHCCYEQDNVVNWKPAAGDILLLNNHRVLYGSTAFESDENDWAFELFGQK